MIKCRQAANSACGKVCCCLECEEKETCKDICNELSTDCKDAFTEETALVAMQNEAAEIISHIANLSVQKKQIEEQEKALKSQLLEAMEKYGVKAFENDAVKFLYVAPTTQTRLDSAKLKKDMPDVAEKYSKTTNVSAYVKVTVK